MIHFELEENEIKILYLLTQHGAMSPSQVAAEMWLLPGETMTMLNSLVEENFVIMRSDKNSSDGMLVAPTAKARSFVKGGSSY